MAATLERVRRPAVVAHRGASADVPEHTLAAYAAAIASGADALECDVRLTRDGHLVCVHDPRIDRTSNGRGWVSALELDQLAELDWGCWRVDLPRQRCGDPRQGGEVDPERCGLLTFERLCELVADAGRRVALAVETKHPTRYGGLVERRVVELLERFGWTRSGADEEPPARVMSFSPRALRLVRLLAPAVPTVLLHDRLPLHLRAGALPAGVPIAGPSIEVVRAQPDYVDAVHRRGGRVHVWTVDAHEDVELCLDLGVDAIITNRPAAVRDRLTSPPMRGAAAHTVHTMY